MKLKIKGNIIILITLIILILLCSNVYASTVGDLVKKYVNDGYKLDNFSKEELEVLKNAQFEDFEAAENDQWVTYGNFDLKSEATNKLATLPSDTPTTPDSDSNVNYWHPKNQQGKIEIWLGYGSGLSGDQVQSIVNSLQNANDQRIKELTEEDIDGLITVLDRVSYTANTSARPSSDEAYELDKFINRLIRFNKCGIKEESAKGKELLKIQTKIKDMEDIAEAEEKIENVISDPGQGSADKNEIKNIIEEKENSISDRHPGETYESMGSPTYNYSTEASLGDIISSANGFLSAANNASTNVISDEDMQKLANTIYNILLVLAISIAVIVGAILGIKFITEGAEGKAEVKKSLIPYVAGCVVVFGAFTIWKIIVTILQTI